MHMRGVYPSHMEGQRSHEEAQNKCILVNEGQAEYLGITSVQLFQGTLESKKKPTTGFSFVSWSLFMSPYVKTTECGPQSQ